MAYMSQTKKAEIAPVIKAICKKYGVKASLSVQHHSTLCLTIASGAIDFIGNYNQTASACSRWNGMVFEPATTYLGVNEYWYHEHFDGKAKEFLAEVITAMNDGNYDHSDVMTDYFCVGWYISIKIGRWDKPYELTA